MPDPKAPTPYVYSSGSPVVSRMAPAIAPIPHVYTPDPATAAATAPKKAAPPKPKKPPIVIAGKAPVDDQFKGTMQFSEAFGTDAGKSWSDSFEPEASKQYFARMVIDQFRVDPLLQGFETRWELPTGWTFVDGLGSILHDEAISNPLYITRVVLSPATVAKAGFRCVVTAKYRP
jgi:hypothetical protein